MPDIKSTACAKAAMRWTVGRLGTVLFLVLGLCWFAQTAGAQEVQVDLAALEGVELRPENAFAFSVVNSSGSAKNARVAGTVKFKGSQLQASYTFSTALQPGTTVFSRERAGNPGWQFSDPALRDLFLTYGKLPQGTYEYCIELSFPGVGGEGAGYPVDACTYQTVEDIFLINLVEPEDNAKIYEHHPMFSWVVNYPFASELTYRVRVAELKSGQNAAAAVTRNNSIYQERGVLATTMTYPVTARPLQTWQPYAWTVDAYYKGLLLGGAEPWRFTIVEDSLLEALPAESAYIDVNVDEGSSRHYAVGEVKLKYAESDFLRNELKVTILRGGKVAGKGEIIWPVNHGDNFNSYDLTYLNLRHKEEVDLMLEFSRVKSQNTKQVIKFRYVNPALVK